MALLRTTIVLAVCGVHAVAQDDLAFHYSSETSPLRYTMDVSVDFGAKQYSRSYSYNLEFELNRHDDGNLQISKLYSTTFGSRGYYGAQHPLFPLITMPPSPGVRGETAIFKPNGELVQVRHPV